MEKAKDDDEEIVRIGECRMKGLFVLEIITNGTLEEDLMEYITPELYLDKV